VGGDRIALADSPLPERRSRVRASSTVLLERQPNPKALQSARTAVEMFLKASIAGRKGLDEKGPKKLSHNLERCLTECLQIDPNSELKAITQEIKLFPDIGARYEALSVPLRDLCRGYELAIFCGATLVRQLTGRDIRLL
jgi:hypothetical protein